MPPEIVFNDEGPLTSAQRTQRLSKLLKQRKAYLVMKAKHYNYVKAVCMFVLRHLCEAPSNFYNENLARFYWLKVQSNQ